MKHKEGQRISARKRWHLNPFRPLDCVGGKVWFGPYYQVKVDHHKPTNQTVEQWRIKLSLLVRRGLTVVSE